MIGRRANGQGVRGGWRAIGLALALALGACEDQSYREIGGEVRLLTTRNDALVAPAIERLRPYGPRALPQIETALHTASDSGRRNLIAALAAIGEAEAVPILRHFAVYDLEANVRQACATVLQEWAKGGDARAEAAVAALDRVADLQAQGEGPVPFRPEAKK